MCNKLIRLAENYHVFQPYSGLRDLLFYLIVVPLGAIALGCAPNQVSNNSSNVQAPSPAAPTNSQPAPVQSPSQAVAKAPVTLPLLDAMFADETFAAELKTKLSLTDDQVAQLQRIARNDVLSLSESASSEDAASTRAAVEKATIEIKKVIGEEKTPQLISFVSERWAGSEDELVIGRPNAVPTDTRVVVNAPAYRMDIFRDGKLIKTYKIGIGYPEFPLPHGLRRATTIIFNPTWTPPDEPWVKGKVEPGKKVEAGSPDNPLGPIKIPIGYPSLIHGGKSPARLGTFASHGCVGLTNQQIQQFALDLAQLAGNDLTKADIAAYAKDKSNTKEAKLDKPIPVELRYETIVVEAGKLHVYRDVYELGTNTEENLRKVLAAYDVSFDDLAPSDKTAVLDALKSMAFDAQGNPVSENDPNRDKQANANKSGKVTRVIKGKKEIVIQLPQLAGKGYPAPVNLIG